MHLKWHFPQKQPKIFGTSSFFAVVSYNLILSVALPGVLELSCALFFFQWIFPKEALEANSYILQTIDEGTVFFN